VKTLKRFVASRKGKIIKRSVGLYRAKPKTSPANRGLLLFSRNTVSDNMKNPQADDCPPMQVSIIKGSNETANKNAVVKSS
jgi:hypothetical protein